MIARSVLPHMQTGGRQLLRSTRRVRILVASLLSCKNRMENECNFNIQNLAVSTNFLPNRLQQHKRLNRCNTICHSSLELKGEGLKHCAQINEIRADFIIQNCIFSTQPYSYSNYVGCKLWLRISVPKETTGLAVNNLEHMSFL